MRKTTLLLLVILVASQPLFAQQQSISRLKVFLDCSGTWCDWQYIRSEINIVDFLLDNEASDVHVLITSQGTGSGGSQYQFIFFGQQGFKNQIDTLRFNTGPNDTDFEIRDLFLQQLKTGLIPFIAKTTAIKHISLILKIPDSSASVAAAVTTANDPWKLWVIRLGADGNINADANYKTTNYNSSISANKITEKIKTGIGINWGNNKSTFQYEENGSSQKFVVNNHNWSANHYLVGSINRHWSWAYDIRYSQNTFTNNKHRALVRAAIEYDVFPYQEVNNKLFTISYGFNIRRNRYYDTTIYDKTLETLVSQRVTAYISLNQKWGNSYAGITYNNYLHNPKLFNLGFDFYTSVRITGGLSFFAFAYGGLTRDQVFLVKGNVTPEEVLARRRQLASGYNYNVSFGVNYRFGSQLNNIVNPRFDRSNSGSDD